MPLPPARATILLEALSDVPTSTSDLYDRVGYPGLLRAGLIQYEGFRRALMTLAADGLAETSQGRDGETLWRHPPAPGDAGG